jgi:hypothetical protein
MSSDVARRVAHAFGDAYERTVDTRGEAARSSRRRRVGRVDIGARLGLLSFGVWLTIAPFALDYQGAGAPPHAAVNDTVAGLAVVTLALLSLVGGAGRR